MKRILSIVFFHAFCFFNAEAQHHVLCGVTVNGGINNYGTIYSFDPTNGKEQVLYSFNMANGGNPLDIELSKKVLLYGTAAHGGANGDGILFSFDFYSKTYNPLVIFDSTNGAYPSRIMQASDNLVYGMPSAGGKKKVGVMFSYNPTTGKDTVLLNFDSVNGARPDGNLIQDTLKGLLYGLADFGGLYNKGVLFSFNPTNSKDSILINFDSLNGSYPIGSCIVLASNEMIYGMTSEGGSSNDGVLFRYNPKTGQDTIIINFNGINGQTPWSNGLIQASDGLLYGMTAQGGTSGNGVLFSLDPLTNIYIPLSTFFGSNGGNFAYGTLVQDPDDSLLYGTTEGGGKYNKGVLFSYNIKTGIETVVHSFSGSPDGANPYSGPIILKDTLTGINEVFSNNDIRVYPNPSNNIFNFEIKNNELEVDIYNVLGEKIYSQFTIQY